MLTIGGRSSPVFLTNPNLSKTHHQSNLNKTLESSFISHRAMRFEKYTNRNFNYTNSSAPNILTYIEPKKYNIKQNNYSVRTKKDKKDSVKNLGKNNVPASNQYYPKYNYIEPPVKHGKNVNKNSF